MSMTLTIKGVTQCEAISEELGINQMKFDNSRARLMKHLASNNFLSAETRDITLFCRSVSTSPVHVEEA